MSRRLPIVHPWPETRLRDFVRNRPGEPRLGRDFVDALELRGILTCRDVFRFIEDGALDFRKLGALSVDLRTLDHIRRNVAVALMERGSRRPFERPGDIERLAQAGEVPLEYESTSDPDAPNMAVWLSENDLRLIASFVDGRRPPFGLDSEEASLLRQRIREARGQPGEFVEIDENFEREFATIEWTPAPGGYEIRTRDSLWPSMSLVRVFRRWDATILGCPMTIVLTGWRDAQGDEPARPTFYLYRHLDGTDNTFLAEDDSFAGLARRALEEARKLVPVHLAPAWTAPASRPIGATDKKPQPMLPGA